jgi:hypothetical protein
MKNKSQFYLAAKAVLATATKPLQNVLPTSRLRWRRDSAALAFHQAGRLAEAEEIYLQILGVQPDQFDCTCWRHFFSTGQLCRRSVKSTLP